MEYAKHIQSDKWKIKRDAAIARAEGACQLCKSTDRLDVHHNTYERLGCEWDSDLVVLCHACHAKFHGHIARDQSRQPMSLKDAYAMVNSRYTIM